MTLSLKNASQYAGFIRMEKLNSGKPWSITFFLILFGLILSSCSLDDSPDELYVQMGVVSGNSSADFYIKMDAGSILRPVEYPSEYTVEDGKRVLVRYSVVNSAESQNYDYTVKVQTISNILTKDLVIIDDEEGRDTLGNDPLRILEVWISKSFLNIEFSFYANNQEHYFDLVLDKEQQEKQDFVTLDFHHNAKDDKAFHNYRGLMSFMLKPLQVEGQDSIELFFRANDDYFTDLEMVYRY